MKFGEVVIEMFEDPGKRFTDGKDQIGFFNGVVSWLDDSGNYKRTLCIGCGLGSDWKEVKQPVTWQEAIQAWAEGRKVSLEGEQFVGIVFTEDITNGTWYIED